MKILSFLFMYFSLTLAWACEEGKTCSHNPSHHDHHGHEMESKMDPRWHSSNDKEKWNFRYSQKGYYMGTSPIQFLVDSVPILPKKGKVLDLAMGEGRNGVYLAKLGYDVLGIDISDVGLKKAQQLAKKNKTVIKTQVADLNTYKLDENAYDIIILSYFLHRDLFPQIKKALKAGGVAIIESYNEGHLKYNPNFNKEWLLKKDELLQQFADLSILRYQNVDDGKTSYSSLLVRKE